MRKLLLGVVLFVPLVFSLNAEVITTIPENSSTTYSKQAAIISVIVPFLIQDDNDIYPSRHLFDNDVDGIDDQLDSDDDNDGVLDNDDYRPLDASITYKPSYAEKVYSDSQTYIREDNPGACKSNCVNAISGLQIIR